MKDRKGKRYTFMGTHDGQESQKQINIDRNLRKINEGRSKEYRILG